MSAIDDILAAFPEPADYLDWIAQKTGMTPAEKLAHAQALADRTREEAIAAEAEAAGLRAELQAREASANLTQRASVAMRAISKRITAAGLDPEIVSCEQALERFATPEEARTIIAATENASTGADPIEARDENTETADSKERRRHAEA